MAALSQTAADAKRNGYFMLSLPDHHSFYARNEYRTTRGAR